MRAAILDQRIAGTSYGWEGARNTSPSAQRVNGAVVRRNRALNPRHVSGGSSAEEGYRWSWTRSYISNFDGLHGVTTACRITSPSKETSGSSRGFDFYGNMDNPAGTSGSYIALPVTPGETLHLECSFAMSFSGSVRMDCRFHDGAGNWVKGTIYGPTVTPSSIGAVTSAYTDVVVQDGSAYVAARLLVADTVTFPPNSTMDLSELYVGAPGDYFDGDTQVNAATINGVTPL